MSSAIRGKQQFRIVHMEVDALFVTTEKSFLDTMIWQPLTLPPLNTGTTRRTSTLRLKKLLGVARRLSGGEMMQAVPTRGKYLMLSIGSKERPSGELTSYRSPVYLLHISKQPTAEHFCSGLSYSRLSLKGFPQGEKSRIWHAGCAYSNSRPQFRRNKPTGTKQTIKWDLRSHLGGAYNPARRQNKRDGSLLQSEKWPAVGGYLPLI